MAHSFISWAITSAVARSSSFPFLNRLLQVLVYLFRETLLHNGVVKNVLSENVSPLNASLIFSHFLSSFSYHSAAYQKKALQLPVGTPLFFLSLCLMLRLFLRNQQFHLFFYLVDNCFCARFEKFTRVVAFASRSLPASMYLRVASANTNCTLYLH